MWLHKSVMLTDSRLWEMRSPLWDREIIAEIMSLMVAMWEVSKPNNLTLNPQSGCIHLYSVAMAMLSSAPYVSAMIAFYSWSEHVVLH